MSHKYSYFYDPLVNQYLRIENTPFDAYRLVGINGVPVYNALVCYNYSPTEIRRVAVTKTFIDQRLKQVKVTEVLKTWASSLTKQVGW